MEDDADEVSGAHAAREGAGFEEQRKSGTVALRTSPAAVIGEPTMLVVGDWSPSLPRPRRSCERDQAGDERASRGGRAGEVEGERMSGRPIFRVWR